MKFKYTGDQSEITIRGVTFKKGKAVLVDSASLAQKLEALSYFQKANRKGSRNDKNRS